MSKRIPAYDRGGIRDLDGLKRRCIVDDITGCWNWGGNSGGRKATVWLPQLGCTAPLGSAVAFLVTGERSGPGRVWRATCGNRLCGNPEHRKPVKPGQQVRPGTIYRDPATRARMSRAQAKHMKLQPQDVRDIRASDEPLKKLAERYGVNAKYLCDIRSGRRRKSDMGAVNSSVFAWRPAA